MFKWLNISLATLLRIWESYTNKNCYIYFKKWIQYNWILINCILEYAHDYLCRYNLFIFLETLILVFFFNFWIL
jgi:hypothetical protein